jgi:lysylphosphatidylglycerol synthase-like protein
MASRPTSARTTALNAVFAIAGGALLYVTVRRVGWADVQSSIKAIGWWYVAIIVLGGLRFAARSRAWSLCAEPERLRVRDAFAATLVGDALGNLTPLGLLASEPAKVLMVKRRISTVTAVAAVAAENTFYSVSVLAMLVMGAIGFFAATSVPAALRLAVQAMLGGVVAVGLVGVWTMRQRPAILTRLARVVAGLSGREVTSIDRLRQIEVHFYAFLMWPISRIARVFAWEALFHIGAVAEVFLVLRLVSNATLLQAFVLEATGRFIVVVFKFVPYRLGVDEAGTAIVARALTLDPTVGVALALVRRIRILIWNAVGLVLLAKR